MSRKVDECAHTESERERKNETNTYKTVSNSFKSNNFFFGSLNMCPLLDWCCCVCVRLMSYKRYFSGACVGCIERLKQRNDQSS